MTPATAKALGKPVPFHFNGVDYQLSPLTYDDQAKFEFFLERRALAALDRLKPALDAADYPKLFLDLIADVAIGRYAFGGTECAKAAKGVPGLKELFYLAISKNHPDVTRSFVDEIFETKALEATTTVGVANADPFAKTAADAKPTP